MVTKYTDMGFLRENTFNNSGTMRDLIQIYLDTTPEMLNKLAHEADSFNVQGVKSTAHKLRSSFSTMGVVEADDLLHEIENSTQKMGKEGVMVAIKKLEIIAEKVEKELTFELQQL